MNEQEKARGYDAAGAESTPGDDLDYEITIRLLGKDFISRGRLVIYMTPEFVEDVAPSVIGATIADRCKELLAKFGDQEHRRQHRMERS